MPNKSSKKNLKREQERREKKEKREKTAFNVKTIICGVLATLALIYVTYNLAIIQFVRGEELSKKAHNQQTKDELISPSRGTIFDSKGEILAQSITVDTISINPGLVTYITNNEVPDDVLAQKLSEIFELDYEETLAKVQSDKSVVVIAKKVEKEKVNQLEDWMAKEGVSAGINIDEDSKRYYPYETLAAGLIGFCGTDNSGQTGLEQRWDNMLTGTAGKIVTVTDVRDNPISDEDEQYVAAENGYNLYLTIDATIQATVEKYLANAMQANPTAESGIAMVMNPQTGEILAMAQYPTFNLNSPQDYSVLGYSQEEWNALEATQRSEQLLELWKNKCVTSTYEPGSTFKLITASAGLEEHIVDPDTPGIFLCTGAYKVAADEEPIKCWRANPHGYQSLREALQNSCNPAFMQLGQKIGARTLYKYFQAFGLFEPVGTDIAKAYKGTFYDIETIGPVELATTSFGQRFEISPLQLVTAVSAICNDGVLVKPKIVKQIQNADTGAIEDVETEVVRQVISKSTSDRVKNMMLSVVTDGTGRHAAVQGYSIGGKSGTSEPRINHEKEGYVASFIGISPIENTQAVVLVALSGLDSWAEHQGGAVAGPYVAKIFSEILPYMGVTGSEVAVEQNVGEEKYIVVPNVKDMTIQDAIVKLQELGFTVINKSGQDPLSTVVVDQMPKYGVTLTENGVVCLYGSTSDERTKVIVPNVKDMSAAQATNALKSKNLNINIDGSTGIVISQDPASDSEVEEGTVVNVVIKEELKDAH